MNDLLQSIPELAEEIGRLFGGNGLSTAEAVRRTQALLEEREKKRQELYRVAEETIEALNRQSAKVLPAALSERELEMERSTYHFD